MYFVFGTHLLENCWMDLAKRGLSWTLSHILVAIAPGVPPGEPKMWFLRRDAMHKRGLPSCGVSVCRSVKTNKGIFEFFSPSGRQAILVFSCLTGWRYSDRNPPSPNGSPNARGVWIIHDFRPISRYNSERLRDKSYSYYGRRIGNRTQAFEWCHFEWPWVTSNPDFKVTILFNIK